VIQLTQLIKLTQLIRGGHASLNRRCQPSLEGNMG